MDIHTHESPYADKLLWAAPDRNEAARVVLARYSTDLILSADMRQTVTDAPKQLLPAILDFDLDSETANTAYVFTEGADKKLYPYRNNKDRLEKGYLLLSKFPRQGGKVSFIDPKRLLEYQEKSFGDPEWRWNIINEILKLVVSDYRERDDLLKNEIGIFANEAKGYPYALNKARNYILRRSLQEDSGKNFKPEWINDVAARAVRGIFTWIKQSSDFSVEYAQLSQTEYELPKLPVIDPELFAEFEELKREISQRVEGNPAGKEKK